VSKKTKKRRRRGRGRRERLDDEEFIQPVNAEELPVEEKDAQEDISEKLDNSKVSYMLQPRITKLLILYCSIILRLIILIIFSSM
jgi:hypothetical protein